MKVLYLAGPMTGKEQDNFPAFFEREEALTEIGYHVVNPATHGTGEAWDYYLRKDVKLLLECEGVAVLPGWQASKGASLEVHIAQTLGMPIIDAYTLATVDPFESQTILEEAIRLTSQDRNQDYGHPLDHHTATAVVIDALLRRAGWSGPPLTARDWQRFIIADKLVRDTERPKRDNEVDIAGYARTMEMAREELERRA